MIMCGSMCSCLLVFGVIFFSILLHMERNHNSYLTRGMSGEQIEDTANAIITTMIV